jgi:hypothetical protein
MNVKEAEIKTFLESLKTNPKTRVVKAEIGTEPVNIADIEYVRGRGTVHESLLIFYEQINGLLIQWEADKADDEDMVGRTKILTFNNAITNWEGVVFFNDTPEGSLLRRFFLIDFFVDEAAVGFFATSEKKPNLFLYQFEGEPFNLKLDINGYIIMLIAAKGFRYWQLVIKSIITGNENSISLKFKKLMPDLFPGFSFTEFEGLYKTLKI